VSGRPIVRRQLDLHLDSHGLAGIPVGWPDPLRPADRSGSGVARSKCATYASERFTSAAA
jgi:hypothetical protein